MYFVYILGPAGSGKTYLTASLAEWMKTQGLDVAIVNLDPAVEWLPYTPDIDIREYITLHDVMRKYNLGPNGALIMAVDLSINFIDNLRAELEAIRPNYIIVDTPGQMEIFAFRIAGPTVISNLSREDKSVALFLIDSYFVSRPSTFISMLFLALSVALAHKLPQIIAISKADLLSSDVLEKVYRWIEEPLTLAQELQQEPISMYSRLDIDYLVETLLEKLIIDIVPVSAITNYGIENLYGAIQRILAGGEDFYTEEPSERL